MILLCASTIVISIMASIYNEVYRLMQHDYVFDAVFLSTITAVTIMILWFERRRLIRLYENEGRWAGNEFIQTSEDQKRGFERELAGSSGVWWPYLNWWHYSNWLGLWTLIVLFISADVYIGWLYPHQHAQLSKIASLVPAQIVSVLTTRNLAKLYQK